MRKVSTPKIDFLQIGFQKCGTTFFRSKVFSKNSDINYIDIASHAELSQIFISHFILPDDLEYDRSVFENKFAEVFEKALSPKPSKALGMLFQFFTYSWGRKFNRKSVIDRLDEYFPDAKFIMFVRNQETWIKSHYSQFLKGGGNIDFYNFIESILTNPYSEAHLIDWFPIVNYCTQKFGSENFRVWLYEELKEDPQKIADELCEYIGVSKIQVDSKPMNPSYNPNEMFAQITLNRLVKYSHGASPYAFGRILHGASPSDFEQMRHDFVYKRFMKLSRRICQAAGSLPPLFQEPMLSRDQKKRMREKYAMNNTKLGQLIGKDLKPYKYPIV